MTCHSSVDLYDHVLHLSMHKPVQCHGITGKLRGICSARGPSKHLEAKGGQLLIILDMFLMLINAYSHRDLKILLQTTQSNTLPLTYATCTLGSDNIIAVIIT